LVSSCNPIAKRNEEVIGTVGNFDTAFELNEETISSPREKLSSGIYSSEQLVRMYLERIESIDKNGAKFKFCNRN
jgi:amidase